VVDVTRTRTPAPTPTADGAFAIKATRGGCYLAARGATSIMAERLRFATTEDARRYALSVGWTRGDIFLVVCETGELLTADGKSTKVVWKS
jgi:hypothetical protein